MDPIISTSVILFAAIEDLPIDLVQLRTNAALKGREASGNVDYAVMIAGVRLHSRACSLPETCATPAVRNFSLSQCSCRRYYLS